MDEDGRHRTKMNSEDFPSKCVAVTNVPVEATQDNVDRLIEKLPYEVVVLRWMNIPGAEKEPNHRWVLEFGSIDGIKLIFLGMLNIILSKITNMCTSVNVHFMKVLFIAIINICAYFRFRKRKCFPENVNFV